MQIIENSVFHTDIVKDRNGKRKKQIPEIKKRNKVSKKQNDEEKIILSISECKWPWWIFKNLLKNTRASFDGNIKKRNKYETTIKYVVMIPKAGTKNAQTRDNIKNLVIYSDRVSDLGPQR